MDLDAFFQRLVGLELVGRHVGAVAAVDDQRLIAQSLGDPGGVHGGVAAAVDGDPPAQLGGVAGFHVLEEAQGVEHFAGVAGRDLGALADMSAHGDEHGVEVAGLFLGQQIVDPVVEHDLDAHVLDALDLGIQHVARQAVGGNAEVHHAAGHRASLMDFDGMAETGQMVGGGQATGTGADHQRPLAAGGNGDFELPVFL